MGRKPMTAEHKAKIIAGRKKRKTDNNFNFELGDTGYAIKRFDKFNYVIFKNGKQITGVWFGDIPAAIKYIMRTTEKHEIKEIMVEWNRVSELADKVFKKMNLEEK